MSKVVSIGNGKSIKLTVFEAQLLRSVFNVRSSVGMKIKDLRLVDRAEKNIKSKLTDPPEPPKYLPAKDGKAFTQEEAQENEKLRAEWSKACEEYDNKEVDYNFDSVDMAIIKQRLTIHPGFTCDDVARSKVISLYDKFDVQ